MKKHFPGFLFAALVVAVPTFANEPAATNKAPAGLEQNLATNKITLKVVKVDSEETVGEDGKASKCRYVKLKALSEINGEAWTSASEVGIVPADPAVAK